MISIFLLPLTVSAQNSNGDAGYVLAIENALSFCLVIPKDNGTDIAATEQTAISACWGNPAGAKPTKNLPNGFIVSAHWVKTPAYTQVTGQYNPAAYDLDPADQGTQFDNSLASQGGVMPWSGCAPFPQYLEFFGSGIYCLRCCNYAFSSYCDPTNDTQGCFSGIPGNYGPGFDNIVQATAPAPLPVRAYLGCAPEVDTCQNGFVCCVATADFTLNPGKRTCQPTSNCASGTIPSTTPRPGSLSPSSTSLTNPSWNTFIPQSWQTSKSTSAATSTKSTSSTPSASPLGPSQNSATTTASSFVALIAASLAGYLIFF